MGAYALFSFKLLIVFLLLIAVAGYLIRRAADASDEPPGIEEVVAELLPLIDDPVLFHRHVKAYLRRKRIYGQGTISALPRPVSGTLTLPLEERVTIEDNGTHREIDIRINLSFHGPDPPTEVRVGDYVEFTGILIDILPKENILVAAVEISELLYIGEKPHQTGVSD